MSMLQLEHKITPPVVVALALSGMWLLSNVVTRNPMYVGLMLALLAWAVLLALPLSARRCL